MSKLIHSFNVFLSWIIYFLSHLIPKFKRTIVFIGWHYEEGREIFADNSKYLFLYLSMHKERFNLKDVVWISNDKTFPQKLRKLGYTSYYKHSFSGIVYALAASYTIVDAYIPFSNWKFSGRSKLVQLFHGIPIKKIGFQKENYPHKSKAWSIFRYPGQFKKIHLLFANTNVQISVFEEAFNTPKENIRVEEHPRTSVLVSNSFKLEDVLLGTDEYLYKTLSERKYVKSIFYTPTFRRDGSYILDEVLDLDVISKWAKKNNYLFIIGLHPKNSNQTKNKKYDNIYFLSSTDIYPLLRYTDLLISDYSSVALDYVWTKKPILFYTPDLDDYIKNEGFTVDYNFIVKDKLVRKFTDLIPKIEEALKTNQDNSDILNYFHSSIIAGSPLRIAREILH